MMQWHSVLFSSLPASKNAVASPSWKYAFSCDASQQRRRACSAAPASVPSTRRGGSDIGEPLKAPVSLSIDTNTAYPHRSKGTEGLNGRVPEPAALPKHIAVIMDGNYRWARQRSLQWNAGHEAGVSSLKQLVTNCCLLGISALTVYAFSKENWQRGDTEVSFLLRLLERTIGTELGELHAQGVRLLFAGDLKSLPESLHQQMQRALDLTAANTKLHLTVAISYGGRQDLLHATQQLAKQVQQGELAPEQITEELLEQYLSTSCVLKQVGAPDLLIRTSGEKRISNFMLWELAYTELFFTDKCWPDFDTAALDEALHAYTQRTRRYGKRTTAS